MLFKTLLQFLIILLISVIIGGVYYNYFLKTSNIEENSEIIEEKIIEEKIENKKKEIKIVKKNENQNLEKEIIKKKNNILNSKKSQTDNKNIAKEEEKESQTDNKNIAKEEEKESHKDTKNIATEENKESQADIKNIKNEKKNENVLNDQKSSQDLGNTLTEVEYLTTDKKGNKYKIFAKSAMTSKEDRNILELNEVRGIISSDKRSNIYIVSDFAKYNSSNLNSNFYKNVIINFEEKKIDCDFFDIDMQTNIAIAYGNVIVTDPKSIMKAGKITLDIQTKDINIEPEVKKKINIVTE